MPKAIDKWFIDVPHAGVAMKADVHSIWISEQLWELGHEVIVANLREFPELLARAAAGELKTKLRRTSGSVAKRFMPTFACGPRKAIQIT